MNKRTIVLTGCFWIPFLSGCVSFHPKPISSEKSAEAFNARTLTNPGLQKFLGTAPAAWDVDTLTKAAFYYNADLDVARAQWKASQAAHKTAGERPNPTFSVGPQWVSNPDAGLTPWILGFSLDIPIETAGKRGLRQKQAAALAEAARQNLAQTAWQIHSNIRFSFLNYLSAQTAEMILRRQADQLNQNADLLSQRSRAGSVSPLNAAQARLLAGRNRLALQDILKLKLDAQAQLADAVGVPIQSVADVVFSSSALSTLPLPTDPIFTEARRAALLGRPDLLAALATYAASEAALELEITKQYPDVHLGPNAAYDQGQNKWGINVSFPVPVFNHNQGLIGEAEAHREEIAARFLSLQDRVINQLDRSIAAYRDAYKKLTIANEVLAEQARQNRSLQDLLRPGDVSRQTLFRAGLDIDSTALVRADAFRLAQEALGAVENAIERPLAGEANLSADAIEKNPREGGN